ncbi:hypothetical protein TNCV_1519451 [Trichonephila clavipes]|nr:hypothetical protein TNCV_1519451 [Trichonephila clavipes]
MVMIEGRGQRDRTPPPLFERCHAEVRAPVFLRPPMLGGDKCDSSGRHSWRDGEFRITGICIKIKNFMMGPQAGSSNLSEVATESIETDGGNTVAQSQNNRCTTRSQSRIPELKRKSAHFRSNKKCKTEEETRSAENPTAVLENVPVQSGPIEETVEGNDGLPNIEKNKAGDEELSNLGQGENESKACRLEVACPSRKTKVAGSISAGVDRFSGCENRRPAWDIFRAKDFSEFKFSSDTLSKILSWQY